eukprot:Phypoly_transcript_15021.p1 GENE.Phypoly_transcript_15021~~Phypoly_transcript_15021.p1  ORF type:complete len:118 (-),score=3.38 Phypoly_transcript_15021:398-751(-)
MVAFWAALLVLVCFFINIFVFIFSILYFNFFDFRISSFAPLAIRFLPCVNSTFRFVRRHVSSSSVPTATNTASTFTSTSAFSHSLKAFFNFGPLYLRLRPAGVQRAHGVFFGFWGFL